MESWLAAGRAFRPAASYREEQREPGCWLRTVTTSRVKQEGKEAGPNRHQGFAMQKPRHENRLPHLETFCLAAELGSFTAAARAVGITQAAVSQRMHALERRLGVALFQRRAGRLQLTQAGEKLYEYAQRLRRLEQEAVARVTGCRAEQSGGLRIGTSTVPGEHLLPETLARFQGRFPQIQMRVQVTNTQQVLQLVERGQVDVGLVGARSDSPRLQFRGFAWDRLVLVVSPQHPLARRSVVNLRELTGQRLIVRESGSGSRQCLEQALRRAGFSLDDWQSVMELGSNLAIQEAVQHGVGIAILSQYAIRDWVESGQLVQVCIARWQAARRFYAVWRRHKPLPVSAQLFLDVLFSHRRSSRKVV
jgi:DNA-binding transcriptional LysR family regulator